MLKKFVFLRFENGTVFLPTKGLLVLFFFFVRFDVSMLSLFQTGTRNIKSSLFETARRESGTVQEHESHACRPPVCAL